MHLFVWVERGLSESKLVVCFWTGHNTKRTKNIPFHFYSHRGPYLYGPCHVQDFFMILKDSPFLNWSRGHV